MYPFEKEVISAWQIFVVPYTFSPFKFAVTAPGQACFDHREPQKKFGGVLM